jgi:hypothetical protein
VPPCCPGTTETPGWPPASPAARLARGPPRPRPARPPAGAAAALAMSPAIMCVLHPPRSSIQPQSLLAQHSLPQQAAAPLAHKLRRRQLLRTAPSGRTTRPGSRLTADLREVVNSIMDAGTPSRARAGTPALDFSAYYGSHALSDCTITIVAHSECEPPATPSSKRQRAAAGAAGGGAGGSAHRALRTVHAPPQLHLAACARPAAPKGPKIRFMSSHGSRRRCAMPRPSPQRPRPSALTPAPSPLRRAAHHYPPSQTSCLATPLC